MPTSTGKCGGGCMYSAGTIATGALRSSTAANEAARATTTGAATGEMSTAVIPGGTRSATSIAAITPAARA